MSFSVFIFITVLSSIEVQFRARRFVEGNIGSITFINDFTFSCFAVSLVCNLTVLLPFAAPDLISSLLLNLGASGMDEKLLLEKVFAFTNADVRPVNNSSEAVNVTLDITFHGVIDMVTTDIKQYCL